MLLNAAEIAGLQRHTPAGAAYRVTVRRADGERTSFLTEDPLEAIAARPEEDGGIEVRVQRREPDGTFRTVIPYVLLGEGSGELELPAPVDPDGLPVRVRVIHRATRECVHDVATFGDHIRIGAASLGGEAPRRLLAYRWDTDRSTWVLWEQAGSTAAQPRPVARSPEDLYAAVRDLVLQGSPLAPEAAEALSGHRADDPRAHFAAQRAIYQILRAAPRAEITADAIHALGAPQGPTGPLQETAAYLGFYGAFNGRFQGADALTATAEALVPHQPLLLDMLDETEARLPAAGSHHLNRAKVLSLTDRDAAAAHLRRAVAASPLFTSHLGWDEGLHTYLAEPEVAAAPPAYGADGLLPGLRAALAERATRHASPRANLVFSMNPRFLRAHGPQWFDLAPVLMGAGLGMIILMVGEPDEVTPLVEEARDLIAGTAAFHGAPHPENLARSVVFVNITLPAFVAEPITFYAAARYLHVRQVLAETGVPAVVLDADITPAIPFDALLAKGAGLDVSLPLSRGHAALSPWRRYMAGTAWFNATPATGRFLETVERYVLHGLARRRSWMLDQNALSFAMEQHGADLRFAELDQAVRPGGQNPIRKAHEQIA